MAVLVGCHLLPLVLILGEGVGEVPHPHAGTAIILVDIEGFLGGEEARLVIPVHDLEAAHDVVDPRRQGVEGHDEKDGQDDLPLAALLPAEKQQDAQDEEPDGAGHDAASGGGEDQTHPHDRPHEDDEEPAGEDPVAGKEGQDSFPEVRTPVGGAAGQGGGIGAGIGRGHDHPHLHKAGEVVAVDIGAVDALFRGVEVPPDVVVSGIGLHDPVEGIEGRRKKDGQDRRLDAAAGPQCLEEAEEEQTVGGPADEGHADGIGVGGDAVPHVAGPGRGDDSGGRQGGQSGHLRLRRQNGEEEIGQRRHLEDQKNGQKDEERRHPRQGPDEDETARRAGAGRASDAVKKVVTGSLFLPGGRTAPPPCPVLVSPPAGGCIRNREIPAVTCVGPDACLPVFARFGPGVRAGRLGVRIFTAEETAGDEEETRRQDAQEDQGIDPGVDGAEQEDAENQGEQLQAEGDLLATGEETFFLPPFLLWQPLEYPFEKTEGFFQLRADFTQKGLNHRKITTRPAGRKPFDASFANYLPAGMHCLTWYSGRPLSRRPRRSRATGRQQRGSDRCRRVPKRRRSAPPPAIPVPPLRGRRCC